MGLLSWIIFGFVAGALAQLIMPGDDPGGARGLRGILITILIGVAGAVVGGFIGQLLGMGNANSFTLKSLILAIGGALLLLLAYKRLKR